MKKIYTTPKTPAVSDLKKSYSPYRAPFIKTISLVSVAAFLSSASPVFACDTWGNIATYFGGGANILKSIAPTYIISGNVYRNVGSAFVAVNKELNDIYKQFQLISSDTFVQQNSAGTITIGALKGGSVVDFANNRREARVLSGVRNGALSPTSDQAVNGSQLYNLGTGVARSLGGGARYDTNGNWISPTFTVKVFDGSGRNTNKNYDNVADAFTGVNDSFTGLNKKIDTLFFYGQNNIVQQVGAGIIAIGARLDGYAVDIRNVRGEARTIVGVRGGVIDPTSTHAINGSQLYKFGTEVAKSFGGGAGYNGRGEWIAPTFTVKVFDKNGNEAEKEYENVADAFTGVSSSFTNLDKKIENIVVNAAGDSLVKQDTTGLITIGGKTSGTKVSIANVDNALRTLSGVKAG
ncbi:hypothetical protein MCO_00515, partial [Bartonella sp. DB5-6]